MAKSEKKLTVTPIRPDQAVILWEVATRDKDYGERGSPNFLPDAIQLLQGWDDLPTQLFDYQGLPSQNIGAVAQFLTEWGKALVDVAQRSENVRKQKMAAAKVKQQKLALQSGEDDEEAEEEE